ncbi:amidohydrolase [Flavobacterium buctense]|uniref:Amidohydrolase n=1 Tax=Flavobacterium buctense TaxID=1648146 RepID=A0ABU9E5I0_9FLAO|nr:amidohydrolase [Flavobacterium buctense]
MKKLITSSLLLLALVSCKKEEVTNPADTIYFGGDIVTMEGEEAQYAEAVAVKDGKILFVGTKDEAEKFHGEKTEMKDLQGKTLIPGFIDGHCHFAAFGSQAISANLLAAPDGNCNTMDDLVNELKSWHQKNGTDKTQGWIIGIGFDDAVLKENRFPTKDDLDKVSKDIPVMATHISGHFCVVNTKGLELLGITAATKQPDGGVIRRVAGTMNPNGVLEELAAIPHMMKLVAPPDRKLSDMYMDAGQKMAASYGYTTCNEGRATKNHEQMADYAQRGKLYLDVNSWIDYSCPQYMKSEWYSKEYKNHYRIAGLKLTLDGSPQGRTAWRKDPYLIPPDGQKEGYNGYPAIPKDEDVQKIVDDAFANNWQLKAHTNGDAAADQLFRAVNKASKKYGNKDRRTTLIHGQLIRMDQLDSIKKYDIVGSFFPMHTFYWGDWYKEIIGPDKAQLISPINSALKKGIRVTSHTDAPVAMPNLMMIMYTTVNRISRSGTVIGPDERLTPYQALKSITIWGAEQFFEEDNKGTLTVGKLADMVVLDKNPLKVDPLTLKDIKVTETIKEGKSIFKK